MVSRITEAGGRACSARPGNRGDLHIHPITTSGAAHGAGGSGDAFDGGGQVGAEADRREVYQVGTRDGDRGAAPT
jgi:hypothetical protein